MQRHRFLFLGSDLPAAILTQRPPAATRPQDQMVDQGNSHHVSGARHPASEGEIFRTRRGITAGVGVEQDDPGCIHFEGATEDLTRFDGGSIQGAPKELFLAEQSMTCVEKEDPHDLLVRLLVPQSKVSGYRRWLTEWTASRHRAMAETLCQRADREQGRGLGLADSADPQRGGPSPSQPSQATHSDQQPLSQLHRIDALSARAQYDGDEFGVSQHISTTEQNPLSWSPMSNALRSPILHLHSHLDENPAANLLKLPRSQNFCADPPV